METKELLELAAKAAGMTGYAYIPAWGGMAKKGSDYFGIPTGLMFGSLWNPLESMADSAALVVALRLDIEWADEFVEAYQLDLQIASGVGYFSEHKDKSAAFRYAVTKAAAEIQLAQENKSESN